MEKKLDLLRMLLLRLFITKMLIQFLKNEIDNFDFNLLTNLIKTFSNVPPFPEIADSAVLSSIKFRLYLFSVYVSATARHTN